MITRGFLWLALVSVSLSPLLGDDTRVGFIEKFALASDREAVLTELVPGTEEYFFYHALHFQNTRQAQKLAAVMADWAKRHPGSEQRRIIENRAALLAYDANPQATLKFLRERLNLQFHHEREALDQPPDLPTALDQARIGLDRYTAEALQDDDLRKVTLSGLEDLVRRKVELRLPQQRALLQRMERPDVEGLLELILADLQRPDPFNGGFGGYPIHLALLPTQLDALAKAIPALIENRAFVHAYLRKLHPSADVDLEENAAQREAWLERLWAFARRLSPSFNTLKAFILYRRLDHDREQGVYSRERFLEYLKLPRRLPYMDPRYLDRPELARFPVELGNDESAKVVLIAPLTTDEPLVREYLLELLKNEANTEAFAPYLRDTYLRAVFAEAKIVNGIGNPNEWAALMPAAQLQNLKERVDLDFPAAAPRTLAPADDVRLQVHVKNVQTLLVRIYEINTLAYYLNRKQQLNTDLNIDGLIASVERTHELADAAATNPFRRVTRTFDFPELKGKRGAWIVEFIGGGKSSRALIRKGQWHVIQRLSAAGDVLTVVDEKRQPVKDAVVWLDGRRYAPDEKTGWITVPFSSEEGAQPVVLADPTGEFASLTSFIRHQEKYRLDAQFHVEREQLLSRREATLAIRTGLLLGDQKIPLQLVEEPRLRITATTLDGAETSTETDEVKLEAGKVFTHKFQVPDRLATLHVELTGRVSKVSAGGEKLDLSASARWQVNGIDRSAQVADLYLSKMGDRYVLEMLGRNGEVLRDRAVHLQLLHHWFQEAMHVALRTNEQGRIDLGPLPGISSLRAQIGPSTSQGNSPRAAEEYPHRRWVLIEADAVHARTIHAMAGEVIHVTWPGTAGGALPRQEASLLETRAETFAIDRFSAMTLVKGALEIKGLAPGDYSLLIDHRGERRKTDIRVTAGAVVDSWILSNDRFLELRNPAPVQIASVTEEAGTVMVQVRNANPLTRVHVVATRFLPEHPHAISSLAEFAVPTPATLQPARRPNLYHSGREIGDEYRYILERRYARTFPGVMLSRPGLILNPWELRETGLQTQQTTTGQAAGRSSGDRDVMQRQKRVPELTQMRAMGIAGPAADQSSNINFLASVAPVIYNLTPDAKGIVRVDGKSLGDRQYLHIYVEDAFSAHWRFIALPEVPTARRDLRLTNNLDPAKPVAESREVTPLKPGETLTLADLLGSDVALYDSLSSVHSLLSALLEEDSSKEKLAKFAFLLKWPQLQEEEKRSKYSEFASHELHFFLSRKDPEFFKAVIEPYLRNKKDKTFMDEYLLHLDLRRHLEPWHYSRLNVVEKALLAKRIPEDAAATERYLRERWELLPITPERLDRLFDSALLGRSLSDSEMNIHRQQMEQEFQMIPGLDPMSKALGNLDRSGTSYLKERGVPAPAAAPSAPAAEEVEVRESLAAGTELFSVLMDQVSSPQAAAELSQLRREMRVLFRSLGPTKEWAENNYYNLPLAAQNAELIPLNGFWRDFAAWDGERSFFSEHLAEAHSNFTEILLALAVLDLPFNSAKHETKVDDRQYSITVASLALAFHKQLMPAEAAEEGAGLMVSESFFRRDDPVEHQGNEQVEKYVTGDFLAGVVYSGHVVVTNPSSASRRVQVLMQIPLGAIAVAGSRPTDSKQLHLQPYSTQKLEYSFYFPAAADQALPHFPAHVAQDGKLLGAAKPFAFQVIGKPAKLDEKSWTYISQYGTEEQVFEFLQKNNLHRLDLQRIAWRARASVEFFRKLISFLRLQHQYEDLLWSYAVAHNERDALTEWLRHREDFVQALGPWLQSPLLTVDPIERRAYQHLEYSPLVNQRAHRLGSETHVRNPAVREQYQALLNILAHKPALDAMDRMSVVYYLFLQDRVGEALAWFGTVQPEQLPTRLQHDYFRCYAAFYEERVADARGIATQYAQYPVPRWQKLFAEVLAQANEIQQKQVERAPDDQPNREAQQAELAQTEPSFDFKIEDRRILLNWQNLQEVTISFYLMDPELMFSSNPFVAQDPARFSIVKPSRSFRQLLAADRDQMEIPFPQEYQRANVLVEVTGAGERKAHAHHANNLRVTLVENYGQLDLRDATNGRAVSKAYVKVYARLKNGEIRFYKDGYTDLRGRFDYASLNSSPGGSDQPVPPPRPLPASGGSGFDHQLLAPAELSLVDRFSILVLSESHGALVREATPPAQ